MIFEPFIIIAIIIAILVLFIFLVVKSNYISEKLKILKLKILLFLKRNDEAKKYALKIVDKNANNVLAHRILAQIYEKDGNINLALDEYIRVAELNNKDYETHYKVAELLKENNKNDEAIIMLQDLLKMKPEYLEATKLLGDILG